MLGWSQQRLEMLTQQDVSAMREVMKCCSCVGKMIAWILNIPEFQTSLSLDEPLRFSMMVTLIIVVSYNSQVMSAREAGAGNTELQRQKANRPSFILQGSVIQAIKLIQNTLKTETHSQT